ncbi:tyrosine-type recombinase/integrase [Lachnoclostridium sp.]|uniref:tyrosine-type recombinase/integrase n=1 Tax=Lachnoclostridium sp. TaxID=2028282 RepID=UPI00289D3B1C|nr:site-specific integrase [Lachnoclostridium sp.]
MSKLSTRNRNKEKVDKNGKTKSPNWEWRFEGAKINGKRNQMTRAGYTTKAEAEREGIKALNEYNNAGLHFEPSEISITDYFDYWIDNYCIVNIADSTLSAYRNIIKNHLNPRIGTYHLRAVNTMILQNLINDIYVKNSFSKDFMNNILKVLKGAFKYAKVTAKLIQMNPAEDVILPKIITSSTREEIIILSKLDVNRILERFKSSNFQYYAILTAYYTGLRVSEVFGLTWDCIDFEKRTITVNKISKKIEKEGKVSEGKRKRGTRGKASTRWYFGDCKTSSSYRTIEIGDTLINALSEFKTYQEKNEKEYGDLYTKIFVKDEITETNRRVKRLIQLQQLDFDIPLKRIFPIFIKENGEFTGTDSIKYVSKVINYELGIKFNFHALRHTHATMLIEADVPVKAISNRLGHGNVRTTLETYIHTTNSMKEDAVNMFEKFGDLSNTSDINIREAKKYKESN